jgi:hypothetical protein
MPQRKNAGVWLSPLACHFINSKDPRLEVGIQYSWLDSSDNALDYSQRSIPSGGTKVELNVMLFTADLRVNQVLDVGAAIGSGSFSSSSGLFDDFSRAVYQPLRVTTRPLSAFIDDRWAEVLQIRFDGTKFKDGFRAEDFGARPDSYNDPGEIVWAWAVKLDITPFLWRR